MTRRIYKMLYFTYAKENAFDAGSADGRAMFNCIHKLPCVCVAQLQIQEFTHYPLLFGKTRSIDQ